METYIPIFGISAAAYAIDRFLLLRDDDPANADGIILYELVKDCPFFFSE